MQLLWISISEHSSGWRLIHVQLECTNRTNVTHCCSCTSLAIWVQHWTTAATEFMCSVPLCHSHWGARQGGELNSLCSFCPVFCKACNIICPSGRADQHLRAHPEQDVVLRSKGQDGILWRCQYAVNMETVSTCRAGMACPAHVHCVGAPTVQSEGWGFSSCIPPTKTASSPCLKCSAQTNY